MAKGDSSSFKHLNTSRMHFIQQRKVEGPGRRYEIDPNNDLKVRSLDSRPRWIVGA